MVVAPENKGRFFSGLAPRLRGQHLDGAIVRSRCRSQECGRVPHHGARYFSAAEELISLCTRGRSAGFPVSGAPIPPRQSLDGFTAGVGSLAHASKALLAEFCYLHP